METAIIYTQPFGVECVIKPKTATGTSQHVLQRPEDDINETQVNVLLQDFEFSDTRVRIGQLIRRERHCDVYSVFIDEDGSRLDERVEARAFIVDGVPTKLKRYRTHCIDRLRCRALLVAAFRGATVIVNEIRQPEKENVKVRSDGETWNGLEQKPELTAMKTEDSEPAKRVRQRERHRVDRKRKAKNTPPEDPPFPNRIPEYYALKNWYEVHMWFERISELYSRFDDRGNARRHDINSRLALPTDGNRNIRLPTTLELWAYKWNEKLQKERCDESRKRLRDSLDDQMELLESLEQIQKGISEVPYQELSLGI
ncbi:hypothetical protein FAUST_4244 [Fusarium austroamericanum]|uniref:Uncharacterized protein n=1 Tax=Fusarium austroamericanum TaxID=282268 RepID=A0AAN6C3G4_FUSAU|nr:hypothetical protein FAUST_4244 [Fusarium austroamericanum]